MDFKAPAGNCIGWLTVGFASYELFLLLPEVTTSVHHQGCDLSHLPAPPILASATSAGGTNLPPKEKKLNGYTFCKRLSDKFIIFHHLSDQEQIYDTLNATDDFSTLQTDTTGSGTCSLVVADRFLWFLVNDTIVERYKLCFS